MSDNVGNIRMRRQGSYRTRLASLDAGLWTRQRGTIQTAIKLLCTPVMVSDYWI